MIPCTNPAQSLIQEILPSGNRHKDIDFIHLSFPNEGTLRKEIHIDIYGSKHHNYYFGNKQPFLYKSIVIGVTLHLSNLRFE